MLIGYDRWNFLTWVLDASLLVRGKPALKKVKLILRAVAAVSPQVDLMVAGGLLLIALVGALVEPGLWLWVATAQILAAVFKELVDNFGLGLDQRILSIELCKLTIGLSDLAFGVAPRVCSLIDKGFEELVCCW